MEDKRKYKEERMHTYWNPKKAHEFIFVTKNGGHVLLSLGSMLATVVSVR